MTIKELANKAGVSTATISRMINENGFISEETRKKIQKVMKESGYDPSRRKRRKVVRSSPALKYGNVVMIWTAGKEQQLSNTGQHLMLGITEALQKIGISLTVAHINDDETIPPALLNGKIDGILIHGPTPSRSVCDHLRKFPVVWLLQSGSVDFGDRVQPDHAFAGELSFEYLVEQGCRNLCTISYAQTSSHFEYSKSRADSFLSHANQSGISCTPLATPQPFNPKTQQADMAGIAATLVDSLCRLNPRSDGLFVANDLGVYIHGELTKRDLIPMKDVLMIAGDANVCVQHMNPEPIKIRIFSQQIGRQAIEILMLRIKNPDVPQTTCFLKPQLIIPQ